MSRVVSAKIAGLKAKEEGLEVTGSVMASDAFFHFETALTLLQRKELLRLFSPEGPCGIKKSLKPRMNTKLQWSSPARDIFVIDGRARK